MPEEDYQKQVQAVVAKLLEKPKTLGGRFRRFWSEISNRQYDFERRGFPHSLYLNVGALITRNVWVMPLSLFIIF